MNQAQKVARLLAMRHHIALSMPPAMQDDISRAAQEIRRLVSEQGDAAVLAIALVGAELAVES